MIQSVEGNHFRRATLLDADSGNSSVVLPVVDMIPGKLVQESFEQYVDECAVGTDQCAQLCQNVIGSYTCSCRTGYRLNADGRRCDGKHLAVCSMSLS